MVREKKMDKTLTCYGIRRKNERCDTIQDRIDNEWKDEGEKPSIETLAHLHNSLLYIIMRIIIMRMCW